ncbi:Patatin-like phospholipase family protein [Cryptosporidium felis]|nr:Patatin-like phospholipase family protein [Cryptosporidium felis]
MTSILSLAKDTFKATLFCQLLSARLLITYILFWYSIPFSVFANYHSGKSHLESKNFNITKGVLNNLKLENIITSNSLDSERNSIDNEKKGTPSETLFNFKPKFAKKFEDPSPNKCYILSMSGGGARGSFSSGLLNGIAMLYRYHGVKLRWDVVSGISIGSFNTVWNQFYHAGHSSHFSLEAASVWKYLTHKNVHDCKKSLSDNAPNFILKAFLRNKDLRNYFCSSYPMVVFIRHLTQNRKRFKGSHWNALAYHFQSSMPYFFNEEIPRALIQHAIRASSSFPIILQPTEISGIGTFADGGMSKSIDIRNAIHRCFQTGKAKTDKDIVIDIVTTSYTSNEYFTVFDPNLAPTMLKFFEWYFYFFALSEAIQEYEIVQSIKRYPNIQFRHFISHLNRQDSIINDIGPFDFVPEYTTKSLLDGLESGFYNSTQFKDIWRPLERDVLPKSDWRLFNRNEVTVPELNGGRVSDPDVDSFVEFPSLKNIPSSPSIINEFLESSDKFSDLKRKLPDQTVLDIQEFIVELHSNIISLRFIEYLRELSRIRDDILMQISESDNYQARRSQFLRAKSASCKTEDSFCNTFGPKEDTREAQSRLLNGKPFFQVSRNVLRSISDSFLYSITVRSALIKSYSKLKNRRLLNKEKMFRGIFDKAFLEFQGFKAQLEKLYDDYDLLMEPLNKVYLKMLKLTEHCNFESRKIPIMFPFLEGEEFRDPIWAPSHEYNELLEAEFKESTLNLLRQLYPSKNWTEKLPKKLSERSSRIRNWMRYKKKLIFHISKANSPESLCWMNHPEILEIISELKSLMKDISNLKVEHYRLVGKITNTQLAIINLGVVSRQYSAELELLFRKKYSDTMYEIEEIFQKTTSNYDDSDISSDFLGGISPETEFQTIKNEILNKISNLNAINF